MTWPIQPPKRTRPRPPWLVRYWRRYEYTTCAAAALILITVALVFLGTPWYKIAAPWAVLTYGFGRVLWDRWRS